jgi:hypothetical protein
LNLDKRPSINTHQGKTAGDKCSTGNNGSIGDKGPSINTEQGKISGDNDPVGNKGYIGLSNITFITC